MSVITMDFESHYLSGRHMVTIILPDAPRSVAPRDYYPAHKKLRVLWLLHGTYGDCTDWIRRTNVELYACEHNLAVVMPSGMNADYVNWKGFGLGYSMYDYLFEELMPMVYNWYPVSDKREDNFIAGLSMGGFGAMVYALNHPEKFAAAGSLSGPIINPRTAAEGMNVPKSHQVAPHLAHLREARIVNQVTNAGGMEAYLASPGNTWDKLIEQEQKGTDLPKLYFCCGDQDFLWGKYQTLKAFVQENGWSGIEFEEEPGYAHEWRFWDKYIEIFIKKYIGKQ